MDYPSAKALAAKVIETAAFEPVSDDLTEDAKKIIDSCKIVMSVRQQFGTYEEYNRELYEYAAEHDKLTEIEYI